jgi:peptide/nickel transport system permease protein
MTRNLIARTLRSRRAKVALLVVSTLALGALLAPVIAPHDPIAQLDLVGLKLAAPSWQHWFGTDDLSRDLLSRIVYGARISLAVAGLSVALSITCGTLVGLAAGLAGGAVDALLMRMVDALLAIPRLILLVVILAFWPQISLPLLVLVLGITSWFDTSRLVRAEVLSVRERPFYAAAVSAGTSTGRLIRNHVLPNVAGPIIVAATLGIGQIILVEAGLSFLGIGIARPTPSWGRMVADSQEIMVSAWWTAAFPGLAIVVTVVAFSVLGDALRDALDPKAS